jgi:hypothetical protein
VIRPIANLVEPVRGFGNNAIRIAHIDTEEPAAAAQHLLIFVAVGLMGEDCFASARRYLNRVRFRVTVQLISLKPGASYDAQKGLLLLVSPSRPIRGLGFESRNRRSSGRLEQEHCC